ncbi:S8 family peptidase [Sphaerotilus mobilis]|uniref:Serine protease n=1 Tax=Sphaerotilus mobilis TaxID=47994 RepID=A0A4Q7LQ02_9BURK|nr:S8 family peptidase [Sphaerotilus mobilis]RZS56866.1 serine protease [Sphaerotilus mobilis]
MPLPARLRRPVRRSAALLVACWLVPALLTWQTPAHAGGDLAPSQRLIVKYREAAPTGAVQARVLSLDRTRPDATDDDEAPVRRAGPLSQRHRLSLRDGPPVGTAGQVLLVDPGQDGQAIARQLAADPEVEYVEEDRRAWRHAAPNDPLHAGGAGTNPVAGQWYLRTPDANLRAAANLDNAWSISTGSADVVVAVLDTGVRPDHPDLVGKLLPGYDFVSDAYVGNDGNGRDGDPSDPGDWVVASDRRTGVCADAALDPSSSWHGTQMAGLIAASTHNGIGMAGTGRHVRILPVRVLGKCGGFTADIADGIRWAAGLSVRGVPDNPNPARIISLSLGGNNACSATYQSAINDARQRGAVVVSSAGNEGVAVGDPANCAGVIAVGGVDHDGHKSYFSNLGSRVTISAPGGDGACVALSCLYPMLSTVNLGTTGPGASGYTNGTTNRAAGTSYATPLVAGVAALLLSVRPEASVAELTGYLTASARAFPAASGDVSTCSSVTTSAQLARCACTTATCGAGLLDAQAALTRALATGQAVATIEPSNTQVDPGTTVVLDGGRSRPFGAVRYHWELVEGSGIASFGSNRTDTAVTTLDISATGMVKVRLTVCPTSAPTCNTQVSGSRSSTVMLRAGDAAVSIASADRGNTGAGALQPGWLFGLACAVMLLAWLRREPLRLAAQDA